MNDLDTELDRLLLDSAVRSDAAHIAHLVLEGRSVEADQYATREDVADRIAAWKALR